MDIQDTMKMAMGNFPSRAEAAKNDYYNEEGLLICGICHEPKEFKVKLNGAMEIKRKRCYCTNTVFAKEDERKKQEAWDAERHYIEQLRKSAFPESSMRNWVFGTDDGSNAELTDLAKRYADNFQIVSAEGMGLLLYGTVGVGKTYMSACIANAVIDKKHKALVTSFPRVCNTLFGVKDKQEYLDELNSYELLVLDDLGVERDTEYMGELIQNIVDARYRARKPLIVTTNLTGDELKHPKDIRSDRVYSRLFEMCYPFEVKGKDRRKMKLKENSEKFKRILGLKE